MEQELQEAVAAAKLSAVRSGMSLKTLVGMANIREEKRVRMIDATSSQKLNSMQRQLELRDKKIAYMTEAVQIEAPEHWADIGAELKRLQEEFDAQNPDEAPQTPVDRTMIFAEGKVNEDELIKRCELFSKDTSSKYWEANDQLKETTADNHRLRAEVQELRAKLVECWTRDLLTMKGHLASIAAKIEVDATKGSKLDGLDYTGLPNPLASLPPIKEALLESDADGAKALALDRMRRKMEGKKVVHSCDNMRETLAAIDEATMVKKDDGKNQEELEVLRAQVSIVLEEAVAEIVARCDLAESNWDLALREAFDGERLKNKEDREIRQSLDERIEQLEADLAASKQVEAILKKTMTQNKKKSRVARGPAPVAPPQAADSVAANPVRSDALADGLPAVAVEVASITGTAAVAESTAAPPRTNPATSAAPGPVPQQRAVEQQQGDEDEEEGMDLPLAQDAPLRMIKDFVEREGLAVNTNISRTRNREDVYGDAIVAWTIKMDAADAPEGHQAGGAS